MDINLRLIVGELIIVFSQRDHHDIFIGSLVGKQPRFYRDADRSENSVDFAE